MIVALVILLMVAIILTVAALKPGEFAVERSTDITAPPERIFVLLEDFHNWPAWATQDRDDPTMQRLYSGAPSGAGAVCDWQGAKSGKGRMTVIECVAPTRLIVQVVFEKPFAATNRNEFALVSDGDTSKVAWSMRGPNLFIMKLMSVFMNMDRTMGRHFERGLAALKSAAESKS